MQIQESDISSQSRGSLWDYILLTKPRETALLTFIGVITAVVAAGGFLPMDRLVLATAAILIASAGANGLTNYLDRDLDAMMSRTCRRVLPAGKIFPLERALAFTVLLSVFGLILAWFIHPVAMVADLVGTLAAVVYRKRVTCVFPQGMIASCAPIMMGWFSGSAVFNWTLLLLCILIIVWLPSHIWSIMVANKDDYNRAGITYFPLNVSVKTVSIILFVFCLALYASSIALYFVGGFGLLYLIVANVLGLLVVYAGWRLMRSESFKDAWKMYKLSAFPFLGIIFLVMAIDIIIK